MTITLELSEDAEAKLRERAAWCGQSITAYLLILAELEDYIERLKARQGAVAAV